MHITHITDRNYFDPDNLSGTPYWISKLLSQEDDTHLHNFHISISLKLLPPLEEFSFYCKKLWFRHVKKLHLDSALFGRRVRHLSDKLQSPIAHLKTDVILTATPISAASLDTKIPIVYWTDAVWDGLVGFYPELRFQHSDTLWDGHEITDIALQKTKLLIFSSQWAARTAVEFYGISKNKIKVVPYGANLDISHTSNDIKAMIKARPRNCIKLLFVGKAWYRKGGDIVLKVAEALHNAGYVIELTIVSEVIDKKVKLFPSYVKYEGILTRKRPEDVAKLKRLYQESHFLFLPSRAEAFGIVFCEANAFGVPCITTYVGGIPEVIKDGINGMTFSLETTVKQYCDYITTLMDNYNEYESLCLSAFNEYQTRLNWQTAIRQVKNLISEII